MFDFSKNGLYSFKTETGTPVSVLVTCGAKWPDSKNKFLTDNEEEVGVDDYTHFVRSTGGACAMKMTEYDLTHRIIPVYQDSLPWLPPEGGYLVIMAASIESAAGQRAAEAVFWHEIGHIVSGHCEVRPTSLEEYIRQEEEADAYAAAKVGKAVMKAALMSTVTHLLPKTGFHEGLNSFMETEGGAPIRLRLLALS